MIWFKVIALVKLKWQVHNPIHATDLFRYPLKKSENQGRGAMSSFVVRYFIYTKLTGLNSAMKLSFACRQPVIFAKSIGWFFAKNNECCQLPTSFPVYLFTIKRRRKKKPWNPWNMRLKFVQIEGIFFRIKYGIRGRQYWKHYYR